MSDWEDDIYDDEDEEELSFEEDGDGDVGGSEMSDDARPDETDGNVNMEEQYFLGKEYKEDENYKAALATFRKIIGACDGTVPKQGEYKFKAIKQAIKVCQDMGDYEQLRDMLDLFFTELKQIPKAYGESSTSKLLIRLNRSANCSPQLLQTIYQKFLDHYNADPEETAAKQKLIIRTSLFLASALIEEENRISEATELLSKMERLVLDSDQPVRNTFLLDVLASEMTIASKHKFSLPELSRLSALANASITGIPQSRIVGIIKECSGLVYMYNDDFKSANQCFQESFKGFNECGDARRSEVLVKFILSNLLCESEINPFKSSDFQGFIKLDKIRGLISMYNSVHDVDIDQFNKITATPEFQSLLWDDKFLQDFLPQVTELLQVRYILKYLGVFSRLSFETLGSKLHIDHTQVEALLVRLFSLGRILNIKLDLVDKVVEKSDPLMHNIIPEIGANDVLENLLANTESRIDLNQLAQDASELQHKVRNSGSISQISLSQNEDDITSSLGNDGSGHSSEMSTGELEQRQADPKFMLVTDGGKPGNLDRLQHDLFIPFKMLPHNVLKDLYTGSLRNTDRVVESKSDLETVLTNYLEFMRTGVPEAQERSTSHLERVRLNKLDEDATELKELRKGKANEVSSIDNNLPDVLETTTMNSIDPTHDEKATEDMSAEELRRHKLKSVLRTTEMIAGYGQLTMFSFKKGLRVNMTETTLEGAQLISTHERAVFTRGVNRFDTESLDSASMGEDDDDHWP